MYRFYRAVTESSFSDPKYSFHAIYFEYQYDNNGIWEFIKSVVTAQGINTSWCLDGEKVDFNANIPLEVYLKDSPNADINLQPNSLTIFELPKQTQKSTSILDCTIL